MSSSIIREKFFLKLFNTPIMLDPEHLAMAQNLVTAEADFEKMLRLKNPPPLPQIARKIRNVGIIDIKGVIAKDISVWDILFGAAPIDLIKTEIKGFLFDKTITDIILNINSPGGEVAGTQEVSQLIRENRNKKRFHSIANPISASAAYMVGSASNRFYLSSKTGRS